MAPATGKRGTKAAGASAQKSSIAQASATDGRWVDAEPSATRGELIVLPAAVPAPILADQALPTGPAAFGGSFSASASAKIGPASVSASVSLSLGGGKSKGGGGKSKGANSVRQGDPDVAYAFTVAIGGTQYAEFAEIGGLSWKAEAIPVRSGGNNEWSHNMRGPGKFEPLTLKRGWFASNGEFFDMIKDSLAGSTKGAKGGRVNLSITVLNRGYQPIAEYQIFNAFITEYSGLALNSMSSAVGFEQIRMAYDYFVYKAG